MLCVEGYVGCFVMIVDELYLLYECLLLLKVVLVGDVDIEIVCVVCFDEFDVLNVEVW